MHMCSCHDCPWKPGSPGRQTALLSPGYGINFPVVMLSPWLPLPKRGPGSALSPWLPVNPPNVVRFAQICSATFRCRMGVPRTSRVVSLHPNSQKQQWNPWKVPFHMQPCSKGFLFLKTQLGCLRFVLHRWISEKTALVLILRMLPLTDVWGLTRKPFLAYIS